MMPRGTAIAVTLAIAGWALLASSGASAHGLFTAAPRALEPDDPDVAIASSGHQVLVFTGRSGRGFAVLARSRSHAGGPWGAPTRLSATTAKRPLRPAVAIRPGGTAVVVWRGPGGTVLSALRPGPSADWVRLPVTRAAGGFIPDVALGGMIATAAWGEGSGTDWRARFATLDVAARTWLVGTTLAIDGPPSIAVGAGGDVSAAWTADWGQSVRASLRPSGAGWQPATLLTMSGAAPATDVARNGAAIAAWQEWSMPGRPSADTRVRAVLQPPGSPSWSSPEDLGVGSFPSVEAAINTAGDAAVTWLGSGGAEANMRRRSGVDGEWGPLITIDRTDAGGSEAARVALDELGNSFFAWIDPEGPGAATLHAWVGPTPLQVPLRTAERRPLCVKKRASLLGLSIPSSQSRWALARVA